MPGSAFALFDSIGVNVHFGEGIERANYPGIKKALCDLGLHHIRNGMNPNFDKPAALLSRSLYDDCGINSTMGATFGEPVALFSQYKAILDGAMVGYEGLNESDNIRPSLAWIAPTQTVQHTIWNAAHDPAHPEFKGMFVEGPSLLFCTSTALGQFGNQGGFYDYANMHRYTGGRPPSAEWGSTNCNGSTGGSGAMRTAIALTDQLTPGKPIMETETGYCTANVDGCVDPNVAVAYTPEIFVNNFAYQKNYGRLFKRTFLYQLLSENLDDGDHSYGLMNPDYSRKPMFAALQGFIARVKDVPAPVRPVSYTLTGATLQIVAVPLSHSDGSFGLILYNSSPILDVNNKKCNPHGCPIVVPPVAVTLNTSIASGGLSMLTPTGAWIDAPIATARQHQPIAVTPYMTIVRWKP